MTLSVDYGLITAQRPFDDATPWEQVYSDCLDLAASAEDAGFDGLWVSEHHLSEDGYLPSVLPLLAALAVHTRRMTLGTNITIAPLHHPLRLAEDVAVVAAIAARRLIVGMGIGYRDEELAAFGVSAAQRARRLEQCIAVCRRAWSGDRITFSCPGLELDGVVLRPHPAHPVEIWLGGAVPAAVSRVGRLADGYVATGGTIDDLASKLEDAEAARPDRSPMAPLGLVSNHLVCVTADGRIDPSVERGIRHMMDVYVGWNETSRDEASRTTVAERLRRPADELAIVGTPGEVAARLLPYVERFAHDREHRMMVRLHYPGMSRSAAERHIERFAADVLPQLRAAVARPERSATDA